MTNLSPTSLAQYIKLDNCERFLRLRLNPDDEQRLLRRWNLTIQPLTPLLKEAGLEFESGVVNQIAAHGETVIDLAQAGAYETLRQVASVQRPTILLQAALEAPLGGYTCAGRADVIHVARDRSGELNVLIADIKATYHERSEHRLQVAVYANLLRAMLNDHARPVGRLRGAILTMQDDGSLPALDPEQPGFDLETYLGIVDRLVSAPDALARRILAQPFEEVFYHLGPKCDGCLYNAICMWDSADRLDLALTPGIRAVEKRVLLDGGVRSLPELAGLLDLPANNRPPLTPPPGGEQRFLALKQRWPLGASLPVLVQRARAILNGFDRSIDSRPFIIGAGFGSLPDPEEHPDLVKIFFDAQHDYLKDRLYLVSALVKGPGGERAVVKCSPNPPTLEDEGRLLREWVSETIAAARQLAAGPEIKIHLYCYNRADQKTLLEALKRHLATVVALPAFFDLLTQSPALSQPMISFLADELVERSNLGLVCAPLHDAARRVKFNWETAQRRYHELFRARMFDNRRSALRQADGSLKRGGPNDHLDDPRRVIIESASRFNSQIPLEYAYAAWGCLPETAEDSHLLEPFRKVSLTDLAAFAAQRGRALAHIEAGFKRKSKGVLKQALKLGEAGDGAPSLAMGLKEFLYIEHHASLQAKLLAYAQPLDQRVSAGMALLLRCVGRHDNTLRFTPEFAALGLDPALALSASRLKEGDWVVLNPAANPPGPGKMKHGALAVIAALSTGQITLDLRPFMPVGKFRYFHDSKMEFTPGELYSLDEMADDLNADKTLDALEHTEGNVFLKWLIERPAAAPDPAAAQSCERFADGVDALLAPKKQHLTRKQREAVAGHSHEPLLLVQGPPGTGKSYTLAWAILARAAALAAAGRPCRVAVTCKTHNAIGVVLHALARARQQIGGFSAQALGGAALGSLQIFKLVNDIQDPLPEGVKPFDSYKDQGSIAPLLNHPLVVFGGTTGGLYNLIKRHPQGGRSVDWSLQPFDLLVIDEASQMSLPEGVLAGAFLKPGGRMIVVGDHRQMPPIVAHPWKEEEKRAITATRPYLSLFEALVERGFPRVALDQSFRLHREMAAFLRDNVYAQDGIQFFSRRDELLLPIPAQDDYVAAALHPRYPIVAIEHDERGSQQYNPLELRLAKPLIEACLRHLSLDGRSGIGVVVPHRAQKTLLRAAFPELAESGAIDTVERFQGDERDVIIVSATASDPDYVRAEADFLLNLNRLNVAISRPRKKLVVIASRSVIELLTSDLEVFENALIWKRLFGQYTPDILHSAQIDGQTIRVRGRRSA